MTTIATMHDEANKALSGYIATGIDGLFQKAKDRLTVAGTDVRNWTPSVENARKLQDLIFQMARRS